MGRNEMTIREDKRKKSLVLKVLEDLKGRFEVERFD
jgi:hypothetical protein